MTWQHYLKETRDELLVRYVEVSEEIAGRCEELGMIQAAEKEIKAHTWKSSEFTTASGRSDEASAMSADTTADYLKRRGELEALREEQAVLVRLLDGSATSQ